MTTSLERLLFVSIIKIKCSATLLIHRLVDSPQIGASSTRETLILERVDAIQSFVTMINQHPQPQERLATN